MGVPQCLTSEFNSFLTWKGESRNRIKTTAEVDQLAGSFKQSVLLSSPVCPGAYSFD